MGQTITLVLAEYEALNEGITLRKAHRAASVTVSNVRVLESHICRSSQLTVLRRFIRLVIKLGKDEWSVIA